MPKEEFSLQSGYQTLLEKVTPIAHTSVLYPWDLLEIHALELVHNSMVHAGNLCPGFPPPSKGGGEAAVKDIIVTTGKI